MVRKATTLKSTARTAMPQKTRASNAASALQEDHTAAFETETPGYDLLNAELSYLLESQGGAEFAFFVKAQNLLDEDIRNSTSFLKDQAPQIGRNFVFGLKVAY